MIKKIFFKYILKHLVNFQMKQDKIQGRKTYIMIRGKYYYLVYTDDAGKLVIYEKGNMVDLLPKDSDFSSETILNALDKEGFSISSLFKGALKKGKK